jgi:hypothetical protein
MARNSAVSLAVLRHLDHVLAAADGFPAVLLEELAGRLLRVDLHGGAPYGAIRSSFPVGR